MHSEGDATRRKTDLMTTAPVQKSIGPIKLSPGVEPSQVFIFLYIVMTLSWSYAFMNLMQPILINDQLGIPSKEQGWLAGMLGTAEQAVFLVFISLAGGFADRFGRRTAIIVSHLGAAVCMIFYPFAGIVASLFIMRSLTGLFKTGWTAGGATKMIDYPDNVSRGKFICFMLIAQAAANAVVMAFVLSKMPGWFESAGATQSEAIRYSFWSMSSVGIVGALVAFFFLNKDSAADRARLRRAVDPDAPPTPSFFKAFAEVFRHAAKSPRFAVALMIGAVIRTDSIIVATFLGLWIINEAQTVGISSIQATATIGLMASIQSVAGFFGPIFFGWLADRMNRLTLLIISLALTSIGFGAIALVDDVFGSFIIAVILVIGIAEAAQTISAQTLFAEEVPEHIRGSAMGIFAFLGTGSVLIISLVAGYLFDAVGFQAPFVLEAALNLVAFVLAAIFMLRSNKKKTGAASAADMAAAPEASS